VSPAPARTSRDAILEAARRLLEQEGLDALTMQAVAERVGVRPPSLYKHVADRAALVRAVGDQVTADLELTLRAAMTSGDAATDLRAMTGAYRTFVLANPNGYGLLFAHLAPELRPDPVAIAAVGRPIVEATARLVGDDEALAAARTVAAWAHGFLAMELAGAFRLGGDVGAAYGAGIELILGGLSASAPRRRPTRRTGSGTGR
jgi:AcrR family transcriptional regulator